MSCLIWLELNYRCGRAHLCSQSLSALFVLVFYNFELCSRFFWLSLGGGLLDTSEGCNTVLWDVSHLFFSNHVIRQSFVSNGYSPQLIWRRPRTQEEIQSGDQLTTVPLYQLLSTLYFFLRYNQIIGLCLRL
jgi:hypothetical protein